MSTTATFTRLNDKLNVYLQYMLDDLDETKIQYHAPVIDDRPIAEVIVHAYAILLENAQVSTGRPRQEDHQIPPTVAELREKIKDMHRQVQEILMEIPEEAYDQPVTMPGGEKMTVRNALVDGVVHGMYHSGLIGAARALGGFPTPEGA